MQIGASAADLDEILNYVFNDNSSESTVLQRDFISHRFSNPNGQSNSVHSTEEVSTTTYGLEERTGGYQSAAPSSISQTPVPSGCNTSVQNSWLDEIFSIHRPLPSERESTFHFQRSYETYVEDSSTSTSTLR
jgi:hypothetical protein